MQGIAILILGALVFLFVKYVLCDGSIIEGTKKAASVSLFLIAVVLCWIVGGALLIFLLLAAFGAFNR